MKKNKILFLVVGLIACTGLLLLGGCKQTVTPEKVTITFNTDGGTPSIAAITIDKGTAMGSKFPSAPTKDGFDFRGWYLATDPGFEEGEWGTAYTATTVINASITLKARWDTASTATWTVTFDTDGGTPETIDPIQVQRGQSMGTQFPVDPTKTDLEFAGWYKTDDTEYTTRYYAATVINENTNLKARWVTPGSLVYWTVTFDTDGGTPAIDEIEVEDGHSMGGQFPTAPTKTGFTFGGWYLATDTTFTTQYTATTLITADTALKARWIPNVTITFDTDGGTPPTIASISIAQGSTMGSQFPMNPAKSGYTFEGWYLATDPGFTGGAWGTRYLATTTINADTALKARWEERGPLYTSVPKDLFELTGELAIEPASTDAEGFMLTGWLRDPDLQKVLDAKPYSVFRVYVGTNENRNTWGIGRIGLNNDDASIPFNGKAGNEFWVDVSVDEVRAFTEDNDIFFNIYNQCWWLGVELWEPGPDFVPPVVIVLVYSADLSTSNMSGGGNLTQDSFALIQAAPPNSVVRCYIQNNSGESRNGWGIGTFGGAGLNGKAGDTFEIDVPVEQITTRSTNIYNQCVFTKIELWVPYKDPVWTITFDVNAGNVAAIRPVEVFQGDNATMGDQFPQDPVRNQFFEFGGWYLADDPGFNDDTAWGTRYLADTVITGDTNLKARWIAIGDPEFTIIFNKNHNEPYGFTEANPKEITVDAGDTISSLPTPPTREGATFVGWFDTAAATGGNQFNPATPITDDATVYARWTLIHPKRTTLQFGKPNLDIADLDELWDEAGDLLITRVYPGDSTADYQAAPDTFGIAKALWDDTGVSVFVRVADPQVTSGAASSNQHLHDSVEVFINERTNSDGTVNNGAPVNYEGGGGPEFGGQYRVHARGGSSGRPGVSGATALIIDGDHPLAVDGKPGYVVMFHATWKAAGTYVPDNNKEIGLEIQINACVGTGGTGTAPDGRVGAMVWNNYINGCYQNVTNYGVATLVGKPKPTTFNITFNQIADPALPDVIDVNLAAGTPATLTVANPNGYTVTWLQGTTVLAEGPSYNVSPAYFTSVGDHYLTVMLERTGSLYSKTVKITVAP